MARRGNNESPVSLFSFQDIITSITGIMFLVVLLLMLMMLSSQPSKQEQQVGESAKELQKELAELKAKLQALRNDQLQLDKQMEELKKLSPEEIQRQKEKYQQELRIERAKLEKLTLAIQVKEEQNKQIKAEHLELSEMVKQRRQVIEDLKAKLKEITETIKQKEVTSKQRSRVMKYVVHSNTSKNPILAELDKDGIRFMDLENKKIIDLRRTGRAAESLSMFVMELSKLNPSQVYFSIAVKPSGFKYVIQTLKILKDNKFERGTEIMPDDITSIFEESQP